MGRRRGGYYEETRRIKRGRLGGDELVISRTWGKMRR